MSEKGIVKKGKERIQELWRINCKQLTVHDNLQLMFEKEEKMKLVQDRLNEVEMELTRLKVEGTGMTSLSTLPVCHLLV